MLTLCAFIWGTAFIAQSVGGNYAEPLTFNCARSVLATIFLFGCCLLFDKAAGKRFTVLGSDDPIYKERLLKGGITCGLFLSLACFFQQLGINIGDHCTPSFLSSTGQPPSVFARISGNISWVLPRWAICPFAMTTISSARRMMRS